MSKSNEVVVEFVELGKKKTRTYSEAEHGEDFADLAKSFVAKHTDKRARIVSGAAAEAAKASEGEDAPKTQPVDETTTEETGKGKGKTTGKGKGK